ncbi:MAG TPA: porin, partial [Candidatus Polarisedimenticolia bacterium]|nr:porin [Candidatus Polarisedimenticolia bacterium]
LVIATAGLGALAPAWAAIPLIDNEKGKLDVEFRFMAWAMDAGPDLPSAPGVNTAPPPAQEENIEDFFVRRMRLVFRGNVSKSLDVYFQFGMDNNGSKVLRDDAGVRIKDAYINYHKWEGVQVVFGQFKVPFLRQNLCSGFNQLLVDRSVVPGLRPAVEGQRDEGGMVWGNHGGFQYRTAIFDGSDQEDTNTSSSLRGAARVSYNWFTKEPGLSYTGTTFGEKRILQIGGQADAQNGRIDARDEAGFATEQRAYHAWAADVFYDQPFGEKWAVTTEAAWLQRRDDYDTDGLDTRRVEGAYGQAGLLLPWDIGPGRMQLVGRWDQIESARGAAPETSQRGRLFGLTWFTKGHDRKIQFDHGTLHERPTDLDDNFYRLSAVVVF